MRLRVSLVKKPLNLKLARTYNMLRQDDEAIRYFDLARKSGDGNVKQDDKLAPKLAAARYARPQFSAFIDKLPQLLAESADSLVGSVDVVVVSHASDEFRRAVSARGPEVQVLDLVRLYRNLPQDATYRGVGW